MDGSPAAERAMSTAYVGDFTALPTISTERLPHVDQALEIASKLPDCKLRDSLIQSAAMHWLTANAILTVSESTISTEQSNEPERK